MKKNLEKYKYKKENNTIQVKLNILNEFKL